uniref:Uncharacterized protein n=1 Tax=Molossus molossus TaxID=27622 RepID=A0A7J8EEQ6_MOLMO|nr:hypothetical protein HJG59_008902 [Molossus molossus]
MGGEGTCELMGRVWCQTHRSPPEAVQEQRPASDQPSAGLPGESTSFAGPWAAAVFCFWGARGNAGTRVISSPLTTPAPAQEAEPAVVRPREPDAGTDPEGCPVPEALPPPAAAPAEAPEPGPAWAASSDPAEATPPLAEGPSLGPALVPASEEGLPLKISSGPAPEQLAETACRRPSGKLVSPHFFDLLFLFIYLFTFLASLWHDSVIYLFVFIFQGIFGSFFFSFFFFLLLCFLSP